MSSTEAEAPAQMELRLEGGRSVMADDGSKLSVFSGDRFNWALEPGGHRMVIGRIRDERLHRMLRDGLLAAPPNGTVVDQWIVPASWCYERRIGLRMQVQQAAPDQIAKLLGANGRPTQ